jgi:S-adenosylmethionine-dependent methyltransferase
LCDSIKNGMMHVHPDSDPGGKLTVTDPSTFDSRAAAFRDYQLTPWSRLRYTVAAANLRPHLAGRPLRILDAGGGNGVESLPLAQEGHTVALLDLSQEMLTDARTSAKALGVLDRMTFHQADLAGIPDRFPAGAFDLILCHNVLQYVSDLPAALGALGHALRPGGVLSVICLNRYSEPLRLALAQFDLSHAYTALEARRVRSVVFDAEVEAYTAEEMARHLAAAGFSLLGQYGIRCVCDYLVNDEVKKDPASFAGLERLELALSGRYPYYLMARAFQLVAVRPGE